MPRRKPGGSTNRKNSAQPATHSSPRSFMCAVRLRCILLMLFAARGDATSSNELQSAAWGGGELRGSKSRRSPTKSKAQSTALTVGFGLSPTPPSGFAAGRQARRFYEPQKQHFLYYPIRWVRPRRAPHAPLMRRSRRGRRFSESRYSLFVKAGRSLRGPKQAWRVAGLRGRRLRPARLCAPQEHSPFIHGHSRRSISALRIQGLRADR